MGAENRRAVGVPQVVRELKRDVFGRVELLEGETGPVVRRIACGSRLPGTRLLARIFLARERRALILLSGIGGVAELLDLPDHARAASLDGNVPEQRHVLMRSWIDGVPLHAAERLPADFFERLEDLVRELHARGLCHNDLHKEPNVLVGPDGYPGLVDFQLASVHARLGRSYHVRVEEDLRHVAKHRRTYARGTGLAGAQAEPRLAGRRRSLVARVWMRLGKPVYNVVTRLVLRRADGEPRRPSTGPWPEWTAAVGPRPPVSAGSPRPPGRSGA